ncbi:hypothetical protein TNCV_703321 [Trichonephila clavipes]|nr:hypothetical protein TNCV_703321 [Trichonephila clavipes]
MCFAPLTPPSLRNATVLCVGLGTEMAYGIDITLDQEVEEKWSPNQPWRGRHNREDQFDPGKAEEGKTTPTSKSEQDQATGMPEEEVINNERTRKEKERVVEDPCP